MQINVVGTLMFAVALMIALAREPMAKGLTAANVKTV